MAAFFEKKNTPRPPENGLSRLAGIGIGLTAFSALIFGSAKQNVAEKPDRPAAVAPHSGLHDPAHEGGDIKLTHTSFPKSDLRILKRGDAGSHIEALQRVLNTANLLPEIKVTGSFDRETEAAVRAFQKHAKLSADGKVGPQTWARLNQILDENSKAGGLLSTIGLAKPQAQVTRVRPATDATFDEVVSKIFKWEGGVNSDRDDPANSGKSVTNKGITQRTYDEFRRRHHLPPQSTLKVTHAEAKRIFYEQYWSRASCDRLPHNIAKVQLDTAVNMGTERANRLLQRALVKMHGPVAVDGRLGPKTFAALRSAVVTEAQEKEFLTHYLNEREADYRRIAEQKNNKKFLNGWLYRVEKLREATGLPSGVGPLMAVTPSEVPECVPLDDPRVEY